MQGTIIIANFKVSPIISKAQQAISHYLSVDVIIPTLRIIIIHKDQRQIYNPIAKALDNFHFQFLRVFLQQLLSDSTLVHTKEVITFSKKISFLNKFNNRYLFPKTFVGLCKHSRCWLVDLEL